MVPVINCHYYYGRDYSTVDSHSKLKCYWTRASCDCRRLQIGDVTREVKFLSNDYTNPNSNQLLPSMRSTLLNGEPSASFRSLKTALFSLALEALLIGVHCRKRYINV